MDDGERSHAISEAMARLVAMLTAVAVVTALGLAAIPVGRLGAYLLLVLAVAIAARRWGWEVGLASSLAATVVFMWAHGRPRFQGTITDVTVIRFGWLLLVFGLGASWLGERRLRRLRAADDGAEGSNEASSPPGGNLVG